MWSPEESPHMVREREHSMADKGKATGKRERIDTGSAAAGGARYVRRDSKGRFTDDQVAVGKSLAADRRQKAKATAPKGDKDRGD